MDILNFEPRVLQIARRFLQKQGTGRIAAADSLFPLYPILFVMNSARKNSTILVELSLCA